MFCASSVHQGGAGLAWACVQHTVQVSRGETLGGGAQGAWTEGQSAPMLCLLAELSVRARTFFVKMAL